MINNGIILSGLRDGRRGGPPQLEQAVRLEVQRGLLLLLLFYHYFYQTYYYHYYYYYHPPRGPGRCPGVAPHRTKQLSNRNMH